MSFPSIEVINNWFQDAHTSAVKAGGSVYIMEKRAEHGVVKDVLRWAYLTILDELEDLNYPTSSRVRIRVSKMLDELYTTDGIDETKDDELVDDYNDEDEDEKEAVIDLNKCKIGQKLRLRCGEIATYTGGTDSDVYPHAANGFVYTSKGRYYADGRKDEDDIVEILPMEDQDVSKESSVEINEDLLGEVITALLKALIDKK